MGDSELRVAVSVSSLGDAGVERAGCEMPLYSSSEYAQRKTRNCSKDREGQSESSRNIEEEDEGGVDMGDCACRCAHIRCSSMPTSDNAISSLRMPSLLNRKNKLKTLLI